MTNTGWQQNSRMQYLADGDTSVIEPDDVPEEEAAPEEPQYAPPQQYAGLPPVILPDTEQYGSWGTPPPQAPPEWSGDDSGLSAPTPISTVAAQPDRYGQAIDEALAKLATRPVAKAPNWLERIAAGAVGGAAGWSNAASRTKHPIDIAAAQQSILHPGQADAMAKWNSEFAPLQERASLEGQRLSAQEKSEQIKAQAEERLAHAQQRQRMADPHYGQVQLNTDWAKTNLPGHAPDQNGQIWVDKTQAVELEREAGKPIIVPQGSSVMIGGRVVATGTPRAATTAVQKYIQDNPNATADDVARYQASLRKPTSPTEAQIKDTQIAADYATAVGKDPAQVTPAEMNAARRMFGSGDPLITASMREFVAKNSRLPNPTEERAIVGKAIQERGVANRVPVPAPQAAAPVLSYTDRRGKTLHFDSQAQLDKYKELVGEQ